MDKAILVGLNVPGKVHSNLDELSDLAFALSIETIQKIAQNAKTISPKYFIGSGKVEEIKKTITVRDADLVIFDDTLSPAQLSNLEKELDVQVIDRSFLILSIFAERAQTKEAVLEVSLAQKLYMLPRLKGMGSILSRQGGGTYNAKGPGETQLELDRRKLMIDIHKIKSQLEKIKKEKAISQQRRLKNNIPIVALVGYTNAGKSSLMNQLSHQLKSNEKEVFEKDMLFATLSTKAKRLQHKNYPPFLLIDTVGFIDKLPHELIRSFESTLSDVVSADLLLHIVDGAHYDPKRVDVTRSVLAELNASSIERLLVLTKKDLSSDVPLLTDDYLFISNKTGENIEDLIHAIYGHLFKTSEIVNLKIPFDHGQIYSDLKDKTTILHTEYQDDGISVRVILTPEQAATLKKYQY